MKFLNFNCQFFKKGFTLVELLIVIAVIGVLATVLVQNFGGVSQKARDTKRKADLSHIKTALEAYRSENDGYPPPSSSIQTVFVSNSTGNWIPGLSNYMQNLPKDPLQSNAGAFVARIFGGSDKTKQVAGTSSVNFNYTGALQTWVVPTGVTQLTATLIGADGAIAQQQYDYGPPYDEDGNPSVIGSHYSGSAGAGGHLTASIPVTPGQTIYIYVGGVGRSSGGGGGGAQGGYNGGGSGGNGRAGNCPGSYGGNGGGGATDIRIGGTATTNRVLVAGGGGGSGNPSSGGSGGFGGRGGTAVGGTGSGYSNTNFQTGGGGSGGTQNSGGAGGSTGLAGGNGGNQGALAAGGNGGIGANCPNGGGGGGGGGGGYYGGGGGGGSEGNYYGSGGGGGSSYTYSQAAGVSSTQGSLNTNSNGSVVISYGSFDFPSGSPTTTPNPSESVPPPSPSANVCGGKEYYYSVSSDRQSYILWSHLENGNDSQVYNSPTSLCKDSPPCSAYNYCVKNAD